MWINVGLLGIGFLGALLGFGRDSLEQNDKSFFRRLTRKGWASLFLITIALSLGIWKEIRSSNAARLAHEEQARLQNDLREARTALLSAEPDILTGVLQATARISREFDFSVAHLTRQDAIPISTESGSGLILFGGDQFEYNFLCDNHLGVVLRAGDLDYPLDSNMGVVRIAGPIGQPMATRIMNPRRIVCDVKIVITSTDRTRVEQLNASIRTALENAKKAQARGELDNK